MPESEERREFDRCLRKQDLEGGESPSTLESEAQELELLTQSTGGAGINSNPKRRKEAEGDPRTGRTAELIVRRYIERHFEAPGLQRGLGALKSAYEGYTMTQWAIRVPPYGA
jgi:hypothetical protein